MMNSRLVWAFLLLSLAVMGTGCVHSPAKPDPALQGVIEALQPEAPQVDAAAEEEAAAEAAVDPVSPDDAAPAAALPIETAQPVELPGCPNLHKVSDDLYRGAQPTAEGMKQLKELGVRTIVNLRSFHSDRDEIGDLELNYEHIFMKAWHPEDKEVVRFLRIVADEANKPVFVHCQHGSDRTGTMCAIYRIAVQGWERKDAIKEMTDGGYGFHYVWQNLIDYLEALDIDRMKKDAGMEE